MPWRGRIEPRLADRLHGNAGGLCDLGVADAARHAVRRGFEIHGLVYVFIDLDAEVYYIIYQQGKKQGWPISREEVPASPPRNDPKAARFTEASPA